MIEKNRNHVGIVVDNHEKTLHDLNASGSIRQHDPEKYLDSAKKTMNYLYDPYNYDNSEMRGQVMNKFSEIHSNYTV